MKTKYLNQAILLSSILLLSFGCTKDSYNDTPVSGNWLMPLLKGEFSPVSLTALNNKTFDFTVYADEIGLNTGTPISSPIPVTVSHAGSFPIEATDLVESFTLDSGQINLTITNQFPVAVKAGTTISLSTSGSSTPVIKLELANDLAAGTAQSYSFDLVEKHISHALNLNVEKLIIDSFSNKQFYGSALLLSVRFIDMGVKELGIAAQKKYEIRDTVDFNGSMIEYDDHDKMLTDSTINATINFTARNHLPVNVTFQVYFLDYTTGGIIDSLFSPRIAVEAAEEAASPVEYHQKTKLYKSRIDQIRTACHVIYTLNLDTYNQHSGTKIINKEQTLSLKASGNIRILFSPSFLNY